MPVIERIRDYKDNSIYFHKKFISNPFLFQCTSGAHLYYGKKHVLKRANENCYDIRLFKKGDFEIKINNKNYICKEKSLVIFNHYSNIEVHPLKGNDFEELSLYFVGPHLDELMHAINLEENIFVKNYSVHKIEQSISEIIRLYTNKGNEIKISSLIYELCLYLINKNKIKILTTNVQNSIDYINKNYNKNISLATIADEIGVDKYYLIKMFKKETGKTPIQFLYNIRIEKGIALLTTTNKKISDISELVGFGDVRNFVNIFKKHTSVSPYEYRNNYQK